MKLGNVGENGVVQEDLGVEITCSSKLLRYKEAKRKFREELRKKALEHEINDYDELRVFEVDRSEFHKRVSERRSSRDKSGNALEIDGNLVTDRKEVLGVWRDHYEKLYSLVEHANLMRISVKESILLKVLKFVMTP